MEDVESADRAVRKLHESDWNGRRLLVEVARNPR
jgi:RNA recognition motif-containing protein